MKEDFGDGLSNPIPIKVTYSSNKKTDIMIEKIHITIILLFFLLLSCNSDNYVGTYINCNYKYTPFIPDIPYVADTLMLYKNLEFTSGYYGKGVYELDNKNKITLYYNYEMGRARFKTVIKNRMNGKPKLSVVCPNRLSYLSDYG